MTKVEEFLKDFHGKTQEDYRSRLKRFFLETKTTEADIDRLAPVEIKHIILEWYNKNEGKITRNTRNAVVCAVRSYCNSDYINKPLKFKRGQIGKPEHDKNSHVFSTQELKSMFEVGDVFEKALLATATSCGFEISAFTSLSRAKIKALIANAKANNSEYVYWMDEREKEQEPRLLVLNPLAIKWLSQYLEVNKDQSPKLFMITEQSITRMLYRLAKEANIVLTGPIRFHRLRAWVESALSHSDLNKWEIDYIMGHALDNVNQAYLLGLKSNIEQKYPTAYEHYLNIMNGNGNGKLRQQVQQTQEGVNALAQQLATVLEENKKLKEELAQTQNMATSTSAKNETSIQELYRMVEALKQGQKKAAEAA